MLTSRVVELKPSATLAVSAKAQSMKAEGEDIISLSAGEPDFFTPIHIVKGACDALMDGDVHYSPVPGKSKLRKAIADDLGKYLHRNVKQEEIIVGVGAKQVLFNGIMSLVESGDEVILPVPYWVSFPDMVRFAGAKLVEVNTEMDDDFVPDLDVLRGKLNDRTKLIILNYPHNPTGTVLSEFDLEQLGELLMQYPNVWIILDETYRHLVYDNFKHVSLLEMFPDLASRTLMVNSFSKTYAMTGWRIGFGYGPSILIKAMSRLMGMTTSGATSFAQTAAIQAVIGSQDCVNDMREIFESRRNMICRLLSEIPEVHFMKPVGAFYMFVNVGHYLGLSGMRGSVNFADYLLRTQKLAVVPGVAFGADDFIRISFVASDENIKEGISRLQAGLISL